MASTAAPGQKRWTPTSTLALLQAFVDYRKNSPSKVSHFHFDLDRSIWDDIVAMIKWPDAHTFDKYACWYKMCSLITVCYQNAISSPKVLEFAAHHSIFTRPPTTTYPHVGVDAALVLLNGFVAWRRQKESSEHFDAHIHGYEWPNIFAQMDQSSIKPPYSSLYAWNFFVALSKKKLYLLGYDKVEFFCAQQKIFARNLQQAVVSSNPEHVTADLSDMDWLAEVEPPKERTRRKFVELDSSSDSLVPPTKRPSPTDETPDQLMTITVPHTLQDILPHATTAAFLGNHAQDTIQIRLERDALLEKLNRQEREYQKKCDEFHFVSEKLNIENNELKLKLDSLQKQSTADRMYQSDTYAVDNNGLLVKYASPQKDFYVLPVLMTKFTVSELLQNYRFASRLTPTYLSEDGGAVLRPLFFEIAISKLLSDDPHAKIVMLQVHIL